MTASRGRALIINIRDEQSTDSSERRGGSEHDYYNLTKMFEKFGFIISELSGDKNWEAKVSHILSLINIWLIGNHIIEIIKQVYSFNISFVIANDSVWDEKKRKRL